MRARARAEGVRVRARAVRRSGQGRRRTLRAGGRPTDRCGRRLNLEGDCLSGWKSGSTPSFFLPSPPKELTNPPRRGSWPPPHAVPRRPTHAPATAPASPRQRPGCRPSFCHVAAIRTYGPGRGHFRSDWTPRGQHPPSPWDGGTDIPAQLLLRRPPPPSLPPSPPSRKLLTAAITCQQSVHSCNGHVIETDSMTACSLTFPLHARVM